MPVAQPSDSHGLGCDHGFAGTTVEYVYPTSDSGPSISDFVFTDSLYRQGNTWV